MNVEHEVKLDRTKMSLIRWMCGFNLKEKMKNAELMELKPVILVTKKVECRWN